MIGFPPMTVAVFIAAASLLIAFDFFMHRKHEVVSLTSAVSWSVFYIVCSFAFAGFIYVEHGQESASLFMTGYALEKVLAFDNLFVFSMIFAYFKIPHEDRHSALHWGIAGAIIFRLIFVAIGASSLDAIGPKIEILFAALILISVWMMVKGGNDDDVDYDKTWYVRAVRKVFPKAGVFFISICVIEISDVMFSFDSVPAIIAVTKDPLLIYSSMIFAVLGLRSMYFVISGLERFFVHMDKAVVVVLLFIAFKLLCNALLGVHIDPVASMAFIVSTLAGGAVASIILKNEVSE